MDSGGQLETISEVDADGYLPLKRLAYDGMR